MKKQTLAGGLVVEFPEGLRLRDTIGETESGLRAIPEEMKAGEDDELLTAVADSPEFTTVALLEIAGGVGRDRLAAMEDTNSEDEVTVRMPLAEGEAAVMLSECDGVLCWEYPDEIEEVEEEGGGLGAAPAESQRVAVFKSRYRPVVDADAEPESLGFVGDFLLKPIKKLVLRFAARKTAEAISDYLERNVQEGPILFTRGGDGAVTWGPVTSFAEAWQGSGARKVLLFVHGTFSSVDGSFGGLLTTNQGADFLSEALGHYDAVIGFDHKTLSKAVHENATELRAALDTLPVGDVTFDAVAYSRGGLVLRYLTEVLLPLHSRSYHVRRAIFVACTNGGTKLADPKHWKKLLDLYTNLVSGAGRAIGFVGGPNTKLTARFVSGAMRGALSFARYLVNESTTHEAVPGLASMDPEGEDVKLINGKQEGQPQAGEVDYFVIEADFDHKLFGEHSLTELGLKKRLFLEFSDNFIDGLFKGAENDLVVDRASMSLIDPWAPEAWIKGRHGFKRDDGVYHTVYFNNEVVADKIKGWLL